MKCGSASAQPRRLYGAICGIRYDASTAFNPAFIRHFVRRPTRHYVRHHSRRNTGVKYGGHPAFARAAEGQQRSTRGGHPRSRRCGRLLLFPANFPTTFPRLRPTVIPIYCPASRPSQVPPCFPPMFPKRGPAYFPKGVPAWYPLHIPTYFPGRSSPAPHISPDQRPCRFPGDSASCSLGSPTRADRVDRRCRRRARARLRRRDRGR
jgi:hypothetical protein